MAISQIGYKRPVANDAEAPNRIRELREALGFNGAEFARMANMDPSTLNKLELGKRDLDLNWMLLLAPLLQCAPADLLPRSANPYLLDKEERDLIDARRAAGATERETFRKVAEAVLPFRSEPPEEAA